jgi:hypothetical protein
MGCCAPKARAPGANSSDFDTQASAPLLHNQQLSSASSGVWVGEGAASAAVPRPPLQRSVSLARDRDAVTPSLYTQWVAIKKAQGGRDVRTWNEDLAEVRASAGWGHPSRSTQQAMRVC